MDRTALGEGVDRGRSDRFGAGPDWAESAHAAERATENAKEALALATNPAMGVRGPKAAETEERKWESLVMSLMDAGPLTTQATKSAGRT